MTKTELLRSANSCFSRAADDEPVFVLRAKDPLAAQTLRLWASMARGIHEDDKVALALEEAKQMEAWRAERGIAKKTEARKTPGIPTSGSGEDVLLVRGHVVEHAPDADFCPRCSGVCRFK